MDLKNYICTNPFIYTEITVDKQHMCCNEWMGLDIKTKGSLTDNWNSNKAKSARQSMLDGTFKYCSTDKCPHLNDVVHNNRPSGPVKIKTDELVKELKSYKLPNSMKVVFDSACNLACPSCRVDFIRNENYITNKSRNILTDIEKSYGESLEFISMSGYGDPFYSEALFEWLCNFSTEKYPNMTNIHMHTNAMLWNERNWEKIKPAQPFIKSAEISIDASNPETYHKVRKGGKWDLLLKNLEFINSLDQVKNIILSFVIQNDNYDQIVSFYKLMDSIFQKERDLTFQYYKILNWGVLSNDEFQDKAIWNTNHRNHNKLVEQIQLLDSFNDKRIVHSLHGI
jgi:wyosine [tRNA(Phe)-imidazoG37] synthetase (radical SAM superfamily)